MRKSSTVFNQVKEFHQSFNQAIDEEPTADILQLRFNLVEEEFLEVVDELANLARANNTETKRLAKIALTKELADLMYVALGTGVALGLPLVEAFNEVHRSNMSKLGDDGKPILREDGKALKSKNYTPANIHQFIT